MSANINGRTTAAGVRRVILVARYLVIDAAIDTVATRTRSSEFAS
jgi:hypothetical protein